jgi:aspartokinase/homoserine dehydrogenase 1
MVVMKFGGTSVGNGTRILEVAKIVSGYRDRQPVVVVSAMSQVTNQLVELAASISGKGPASKTQASLKKIKQTHMDAAKALDLEPAPEEALLVLIDNLVGELEATTESMLALGEMTTHGHDLITSFGERLSIQLVAAALRHQGMVVEAIESSDLIVTDDRFGNATPQLAASRARMKPKLERLIKNNTVPVITGFIGATADHVLTTLGRGGSDYSATIIGHCIDAEEVWIWTDVTGVMTADPRAVKGAHTIKDLSYDEAAELSYFGAKVLHPKTMVPAALSNIPLIIKNTMDPSATGTTISDRVYQHPDGVKAMTVLNHLSLITVQGKGMQGVLGVAARVFTTLAEHQINVMFISQASAENNISLVINEHDGERAVTALRAAFKDELASKNIEMVNQQSHLSMIAVVGEGMSRQRNVAGRLFTAVGEAGVNIMAIAQGSSERNISFVVSESDANLALQSIHDELHLEKLKSRGARW